MPDTLAAAFAGLPTARPEEIGLEPSALKRLTAAMEREVAPGRAPGVSLLIARRGTVGFAETLGALRWARADRGSRGRIFLGRRSGRRVLVLA